MKENSNNNLLKGAWKEVNDNRCVKDTNENVRISTNITLDEGETLQERIEKLCSQIVAVLTERNQTLSTVESLTGGMLSSFICNIPGASKVFKGGFITYWEELKKSLCNVSQETLKEYTVVSKEVAEEMASGCKEKTDTDYCVSTTGVAGPGSDEYGNPIGKLCFALISGKTLYSFEVKLSGNTRQENREQACFYALNALLELIKE